MSTKRCKEGQARRSHVTASSSLVSSSFSLSLFSSSLSFLNSSGDGSLVASVWAFCSSSTVPGEKRGGYFCTARPRWPMANSRSSTFKDMVNGLRQCSPFLALLHLSEALYKRPIIHSFTHSHIHTPLGAEAMQDAAHLIGSNIIILRIYQYSFTERAVNNRYIIFFIFFFYY